MSITPEDVLSVLRAALGRQVDIDLDLPLIESDLRVNSLTMFTVLSELERLAGVEMSQDELIKLSAGSINELTAGFCQRLRARPSGRLTNEDGQDRAARQFYWAADVADLEEGQTKAVVISGRNIVIGKHQQNIFAVENRCSHQGKELVNALLRQGQIICPHHGARFDLATGAAYGPHTTCAIVTFESRVVDGRIEVSLPMPHGCIGA